MGIRISDKISNPKLRSRTQIRDMGEITKKLKFKYAGHISRIKKERWSKRTTREYKRKVERPRVRWRDEIRNRVCTDWG